ncbi:MAG: sensor histidine kinase [Treponema sp.]|nr:sensor histidine kinase [Treponema sp.]
MFGIASTFERLLNKVSVKKSLRIIFLFIFILPVIIISIVFIAFLYNTMLDGETQRVKAYMKQTEETFEASLTEVQNFSDRIYLSKTLQDVLSTQYTDIQQIYNDYASLNFLENYLLTYEQIANYRIYTENTSLLDNSFIVKADFKTQYSEWYVTGQNLKGRPYWTLRRDEISKKDFICLIRSLWNQSGDYLGVLVVNIDPEVINQRLNKSLFNTAVFVNHKIVYSAFNEFSMESVQELSKIEEEMELTSHSITKVRLNNQSYGIISENVFDPDDSALKFTFVYIIPMMQLVMATSKMLVLSISIFLIMLLLSFMVMLLFTNYLDSRVNKVQSGISNVVSKNFEIAPSIGGSDEFEAIYHELYEMSKDIKNLINEIYRQNIEKEQFLSKQSEMSFKMLSNQINPHFLFNTLETIRMKSIASGEKDVATMLKLLASLLRYNLGIKGKPVPLIQELEAIQNYLNIQHMRFEDRVSYDIVTMCDIKDVMILPLLIQPLVENSFSHGLEDRVSGGFIYILINTENQKGKKIMNISVKDNGCGIDEDKLEELNKELKSAVDDIDSTHIGIANVNSRIKLYYGKEYGLSINSDFGEGTVVTIKIPV